MPADAPALGSVTCPTCGGSRRCPFSPADPCGWCGGIGEVPADPPPAPTLRARVEAVVVEVEGRAADARREADELGLVGRHVEAAGKAYLSLGLLTALALLRAAVKEAGDG